MIINRKFLNILKEVFKEVLKDENNSKFKIIEKYFTRGEKIGIACVAFELTGECDKPFLNFFAETIKYINSELFCYSDNERLHIENFLKGLTKDTKVKSKNIYFNIYYSFENQSSYIKDEFGGVFVKVPKVKKIIAILDFFKGILNVLNESLLTDDGFKSEVKSVVNDINELLKDLEGINE